MNVKKTKFNINLPLFICAVSALVLVSACDQKEVFVQDNDRIPSVENTGKINSDIENILEKREESSNVIGDKITDKIGDNNSTTIPKKELEKREESSNGISNYIGENNIIISLSNVYVVDGDTIHASNGSGEIIKVRLVGIDAPESSQSMGDLSTGSLRDCVQSSGDIKLIANKDNLNDKYGRYLGKVIASNTDCNLSQVQKGMAWFYEDYADNLPKGDAYSFKNAQETARANRDGIWVSDPMPPWEYRKNNK